jgi:hypothetical protein
MFLRKPVRVVAALLLVLSFGITINAQRGGRWDYLGEANVDGQIDHDRIRVGRSDGRFRAIQIRVENAPITFQRVIVHYGNGGDEEIAIRNRIPAGGRTRVIDLKGYERVIESVEFWYAKANYNSRRPKLRLFGRS